MKMRSFVISITIFVFLSAIFGCGRAENYGERITNTKNTPIKDILIHPEEYNGKTVTVTGRIIDECSTGCWFDLKEGGAVLYIDLSPSGFAVPQNVGKKATVEGKISIRDGKPILTGKGAVVR